MTNKERYVELCSREPGIALYSQPFWLDAVSEGSGGGYKCSVYWDVCIYEKKGRIIGALPFFVRKKYGLKYITQPIRTKQTCCWIKYPANCKSSKRIALEREVVGALIEQLESMCREQGIVYYQQSFLPEFTNWLPFYWKGYKETTAYTYRIEKGLSYEQVSGNYDSGLRYDIKRAAVQAKIYETEDVCLLYKMHCMTMERQEKNSQYSMEFMQRFDNVCKGQGCRKIFVAEDVETNVHCAIYIAWDEDWVYYLWAGTDPQYRKYNFSTLLLDHAIRFACEAGKGFDFEGSMIPGIELFFSKFGGKQEVFHTIRKVYTKNPFIKAAVEKRLNG